MKSALSGAEIIFELEHELQTFTFPFSFVPFSLNPPCLKHCCNMIISTRLVSFLRLIDFLVSSYHIHWQPELPSETLVPKLDFQRNGPCFHLAYLPCGKAVQSLMSSREQGIRKTANSILLSPWIISFSRWSSQWPAWSASCPNEQSHGSDSRLEWTGRSVPCHAPTQRGTQRAFWHHPLLQDGEICRTDTHRHLDIYINTDRLSYSYKYLDIWLSISIYLLYLEIDRYWYRYPDIPSPSR